MDNETNGYNHTCPCCGYKVETDWKTYERTEGDEDFILITRDHIQYNFLTDRAKHDGFGSYHKVVLLGCPKCNCVSFQFNSII